jgi:uncharacterized repeat protein (TIGR01451 family)
MKRFFFTLILFLPFGVFAQSGIITTIAGTAYPGYSGDGGAASLAQLSVPTDVAFDKFGNLYIADHDNNRIRKINPAGIISTVIGTDTAGFSGDGGPASMAKIDGPLSVTFDPKGNMYITDGNRIRKIDTAGIITTFAGNGTGSFSGDGGSATSATLSGPQYVSSDTAGNIFIADLFNYRVRKVDLSGIITTVAGNGSWASSGDGGHADSAGMTAQAANVDVEGNIYIADQYGSSIRKVNTAGIISTIAGNGYMGYAGDGGPAKLAELADPYGVAVDRFHNIYISDFWNYRLRKINSSGIITTIAGMGGAEIAGDGGPATDAELDYVRNSTLDVFGNIFIPDQTLGVIRKISRSPDINADSFSVYINSCCNNLNLVFSTIGYSAPLNVITYFGDGTSSSNIIDSGYGGGYGTISHAYNSSGTFTIKNVLYNGLIAIDSISYPYAVYICGSLPVKFYYDEESSCVFDSTIDNYIQQPVVTEIDSNGITIDTISGTSGFYYNAIGDSGDIYSFKVISSPGIIASCPSPSGIISDTLGDIYSNYPTRYVGFQCVTGSAFDVAEFASLKTGRHMQTGTILANNSYCHPESTTLTMQFSSKYNFESAYPEPDTVIGNTISWKLGTLSVSSPIAPVIEFTLSIPTPDTVSTWLAPGDTANSKLVATPIAGDIDTNNNVITRTDTVVSSYDPNEMSVSPQGYILPGTELQYTINFENTGNGTAHDIYVMDTLSPDIKLSSLRLVAASAVMNVSVINSGGNNVVKFDFPNINLLDSSYHNQCDGMVIFNVNVPTGLANGATIFNHAGIFFDDNPAVITDTVENIVGLIEGVNSLCAGSEAILTETVVGGIWSSSNGSATVSLGTITGVSSGTDTISYSITNQLGTTVTKKVITVSAGLPNAGTITGPSAVCVASTITLVDTISGGVWKSDNSSAYVLDGVLSGISIGIDTVSYTVTNGCGTSFTTVTINVNPLPVVPDTIIGLNSLCTGDTITLTDITEGGSWSNSNSSASVSDGIVWGMTKGIDTISYTISNSCGNASTTKIITVNSLPEAGVITGPLIVCIGSPITLSDTSTGGAWVSTNTSATIIGGVVSGFFSGLDTIQYILNNACGSDSAIVTIGVDALPPVPSAITGTSLVCVGDTIHLEDLTADGIWSNSNSCAMVISGSVIGFSDGIDTIIYTVSNSCGSKVASKVITVNPQLNPGVIIGPMTVCVGADITLTDTATGGFWNKTNNFAKVSGGTVTGISGGTDTIMYEVSNNCGTRAAKAIITVDPLPNVGTITGVDTVCVGQSVTLSETSTDGNWSSKNTYATIDSEGVVLGISEGIDTLSYSATNSCGTKSTDFVINVLPSTSCNAESIRTINATAANLNVYPNPNEGSFDVILSSSFDEPAILTITNILGEKMNTLTITSNIIYKLELNQPAGIYILSVATFQGKYIVKVTIE